MNLFELCTRLQPTSMQDVALPSYLLGAFRRKSISFSNGLTDEKTIVYWFQSKSFTIDLRLKHPNATPILERQGWISDTIWDEQEQLLSWNLSSNYQNHVQWPEPAKLHAIGNAIFEFSPSYTYVEDWRQQASRGLYLGLKLFKIENLDRNIAYKADGGLIICDHFIAYCKARHPQIQQRFNTGESLTDAFAQQQISIDDIQDFVVSISFEEQKIHLSTVSNRIGQSINLDDFEQIDAETIVQRQVVEGENCLFYFKLDIFQPDFFFTTMTDTTKDSENWFKHEKNHLFHHAKITF